MCNFTNTGVIAVRKRIFDLHAGPDKIYIHPYGYIEVVAVRGYFGIREVECLSCVCGCYIYNVNVGHEISSYIEKIGEIGVELLGRDVIYGAETAKKDSEANGKLAWDMYGLLLAHTARTRSFDPSTQHGAYICDADHRNVSSGYNGPLAGVDDSQVPTTRPEKYNYMIHAEANAIAAAKRDLTGCTIYVTGWPCVNCMNQILQSGIRRIVCVDFTSNMQQGNDSIATVKKLAELAKAEIVVVSPDDYKAAIASKIHLIAEANRNA